MTTPNVGVTMNITITVLITENKVWRNDLSDRGTASSIVCTSFENRFKILPVGVVSKKDIGARSIFANIPLWRDLEALMPAVAIVKEEHSMNTV